MRIFTARTLYSPDHKIVALGELKSYREDNNIVIRAFITSRMNLWDDDTPIQKDVKKNFDTKDIANPDRLKRQLKSICDLLDYRINDIQKNVQSDSLSNLLDNIDKHKQTFVVNPENNIIVIGITSTNGSLANALLGESKKIMPSANVSNMFLQISKPANKYNRIIMIDFNHKMAIGRIPIFWWNTEINVIRKLIFRKLAIVTIFNPVSLYEHYASQGFTIIEGKDKSILFEKQFDAKKITIGNIMSYIDLIANSFLSVDAIIRIIDRALDEVSKLEVTENTKFNLSIIQKDM